MKKAICLLLLLSSCSATQEGWFQYEPVVDLRGVKADKYQHDLHECYGYADKVDVVGEFVRKTGTAILIGGAGGAAIGAISGQAATGAALGAGVGGLIGEDTTSARRRQELIINRCLIGRGYKFLG